MKISCYRIAVPEDAEEIAKLVNNAYRPSTENRGWTHESDLVSGDRTNVDQVREAIARRKSAVLVGLLENEIVACVHVEQTENNAHIGMLSVSPRFQQTGIGKEVLAYAEEYAKSQFSFEKFIMVVVSSRSELIAFYMRRGYQPTGEEMVPTFGRRWRAQT